jgi:iron complex transport system substrate-binding protein
VKRALAALFLIGLAGFAQAEPARPTIVSLDYCADQFVLALADRDQILAVSKDAERQFSYLRDKATGIPKVRAAAEDVIALQPDLVVRSFGGDPQALAFYERFGIRTVQLGYADDIQGTVRILREVAAEIGQAGRGEALIDAMPRPQAQSGASALYVTPGGVSAGRDTLIDAVLRHAGLANANTGTGWTSLPLEALVQAPPRLMVTAFFGFDDDATDLWSVSRHPVMQRLVESADVIATDEARISCPAWFIADEALAISDAARGLR